MRPRFTSWVRSASVARKVLRLAAPERVRVLIVGVLGAVAAFFEGAGLSFLIPLASLMAGRSPEMDVPALGAILDVVERFATPDPLTIILIIAGLFVSGTLVGYVNGVLSTVLAMRFAHRLRMRVFADLLTRPVSVIESLPDGKFVNTLAGETWRACDALFVIIGAGVQAIAVLVFALLLFLISPFYFAFMMAMTAAMALIVIVATRSVRHLGQATVAANEAFTAGMWDSLLGLRVIRGFGREADEARRFEARSEAVFRLFVRLGVVSGLVGPITRVLTVGIVATLLVVALARGDEIATLAGFLAIAYRMQPRVAAVLGAETKLRELEAPVSEIEAVMARPVAEGGPDRLARRHGPLRSGVSLHTVSARYPGVARAAIEEVSCEFRVGRLTAVAGASGAGKSTLVALLLRFLSPRDGEIRVDGRPLQEIDPLDWHQRIAFVEQNAHLFGGTIAENIRYARPDASRAELRQAAERAQALDFIEVLPDGFETRIGGAGVNLSQGQRQRIALARALIREPEILILDEATNALDRPTEQALRAALRDGPRPKVGIVIAHRRETIEDADEVLVLEDGRVVEAGPPAELAARGGVFARLYLDEAPKGEDARLAEAAET